MKLSHYLTGIRIATTANPNHTQLKHDGEFDPTGKAVCTEHGWVIPAVNTLRKPRTLLEEAGKIIEMKTKQLKRQAR